MIKIYEVNKDNPTLLDQLNKKKSYGTVLIYSDHCPHCTTMKPQWEQMKEKMRNKPANIYEINGEELPHINHPIKNVVDGFPMILNVNNREIVPFEQERTMDNFVKFVESNLLKTKPPPRLFSRKRLKVGDNMNNTNNRGNNMNVSNNNDHNFLRGSQIGDSLNLDKYISKKLPFINVKKKNTTKKVRIPKRVRMPKKPRVVKKDVSRKPKKRKGIFSKNKKDNNSRKKRRI